MFGKSCHRGHCTDELGFLHADNAKGVIKAHEGDRAHREVSQSANHVLLPLREVSVRVRKFIGFAGPQGETLREIRSEDFNHRDSYTGALGLLRQQSASQVGFAFVGQGNFDETVIDPLAVVVGVVFPLLAVHDLAEPFVHKALDRPWVDYASHGHTAPGLVHLPVATLLCLVAPDFYGRFDDLQGILL